MRFVRRLEGGEAWSRAEVLSSSTVDGEPLGDAIKSGALVLTDTDVLVRGAGDAFTAMRDGDVLFRQDNGRWRVLPAGQFNEEFVEVGEAQKAPESTLQKREIRLGDPVIVILPGRADNGPMGKRYAAIVTALEGETINAYVFPASGSAFTLTGARLEASIDRGRDQKTAGYELA
jgi:hypothetical protein